MDLNNDVGLNLEFDGSAFEEDRPSNEMPRPYNEASPAASEDEEQDSHKNEQEDTGTSQVIKPKRVIKNPQPKLDATRLMGPRGIVSLQSSFRNAKFKGRGHEKEDLTMMMKKLEHWAHRLFPKLKFDDTLKQIEKLGTKKPVQNMMKRIRLDMFQSDEMTNDQGTREFDNEKETRDVEEEIAQKNDDVFDQLVVSVPFAAAKTSTDTMLPEPPEPIANTCSTKVTSLTEEQRERMERNRRLALERRKSRMQEQKDKPQKENEMPLNEEIVSLSQNNPSKENENTLKEKIVSLSQDNLPKENEMPLNKKIVSLSQDNPPKENEKIAALSQNNPPKENGNQLKEEIVPLSQDNPPKENEKNVALSQNNPLKENENNLNEKIVPLSQDNPPEENEQIAALSQDISPKENEKIAALSQDNLPKENGNHPTQKISSLSQNVDRIPWGTPGKDSIKDTTGNVDTPMDLNEPSNEMDCDVVSAERSESNVDVEMEELAVNLSNEPELTSIVEGSSTHNSNDPAKECEKSNECELFTESDVLNFVNENDN